jgi:hypothetical protein
MEEKELRCENSSRQSLPEIYSTVYIFPSSEAQLSSPLLAR